MTVTSELFDIVLPFFKIVRILNSYNVTLTYLLPNVIEGMMELCDTTDFQRLANSPCLRICVSSM